MVVFGGVADKDSPIQMMVNDILRLRPSNIKNIFDLLY